MPAISDRQHRTFLVPEVVQTSAMDCGPASLTALLEGFGIRGSYGRLREACHTDVDGTSIDTMEEIALLLGLDAEQIMLPSDHLLLTESQSLPAIVVVQLPNGFTHFVLLWRKHGPLVQIMDPASGRRWERRDEFLNNLYVHQMPVPAQAWRDYAAEKEFIAGLRKRMALVGVSNSLAEQLIATGLADPEWRSIATLDAALRMTQALQDAGGIAGRRGAGRLLEGLYREAIEHDEREVIPNRYWSVRPHPPDEDGEEQLTLRGAVLVRVRGKRTDVKESAQEEQPLPPDLVRALEEPSPRPIRLLYSHLRAEGVPLLLIAAIASIIAGAGVLVEALLFRVIFELPPFLTLFEQRVFGIGAIAIPILVLLLLEIPIAVLLYRFGRKLEITLLISFMEKIPRLGDRYFQSRPISDMAERSHALHLLRQIPLYGGQLLRLPAQFILTMIGIIWLVPDQAWTVLVGSVVIFLLPLIAHPFLASRDLRMRTHRGGLAHFYLDAMLGLTPIRAHGAEKSVRREHRSLLSEWERAGLDLYRAIVPTNTIHIAGGTGLAIWLLLNHISQHGVTSSVLLLSYWSLQLSTISEGVSLLIQRYPTYRTILLRMLEPLGTPEEDEGKEPEGLEKMIEGSEVMGAAIQMRDVCVTAAGGTILDQINLTIHPGQHIAIVGRSGAGKSTLVGLLLGWYRPASGEIDIDGVPLTGNRLPSLRRRTVWVDPSTQLWNNSLLDNLLYGNEPNATHHVGESLKEADLLSVLERLPEGLTTSLGEGGGFLSAGEGQRVRLGRGFLRDDARLIILDEPFRGLDRSKRQLLLSRVRKHWKNATILCITHDVAIAPSFERIMVIEDGKVVEDDSPEVLRAKPDSRFTALLNTDLSAMEEIWSAKMWRRLRMEEGKIVEIEDHPEGKE